jgi:predicted transposase YbfD/YdcC
MTPHEAITYIRDHWQQESFHWVKDVVLDEDACPTKNRNGSRTLGLLRNAVVRVGRSLFGSVKTFVEHFSASPEQTYDSRL